jgi:hypothetical protein
VAAAAVVIFGLREMFYTAKAAAAPSSLRPKSIGSSCSLMDGKVLRAQQYRVEWEEEECVCRTGFGALYRRSTRNK